MKNSVKIALISLCLSPVAGAQIFGGQIVRLQVGQSISASQLNSGDVVTCGEMGPNPGPLPAPTPPPAPCGLSSVRSSIYSLRSAINRLQNGKCAYRVNRCGDNLEDHAVGDSKNALYNDFLSTRRSLETECDRQTCDGFEIRQAARDFDDVLSLAQRSSMTYKEDSSEIRHQTPMLDSASGLRPRCFGF
jgi:hypothetical protein